ncbi:MAG: potassium transporter TrkG [Bacteroidota bacterium]|nr:potassium transporter TrkG [Bacteroidota bacterium]MEC8400701.1 potassium transporter TrkG [Bacteroidota bacterium]
MNWQSFRERANVWLYDSKERVLGTFQWLTLLVNLSALSVLAIYYGYEHDAETSASLFEAVKFSFGFYVLHYLVRVLYHFHPTTFFKETWGEGLVMAVLLVEGVGDLLWGAPPLGQGLAVLMPSIGDFSTFLVQGYLFVAVLMEWMRPGSRLPRVRLNPAVIFILSFVVLIVVGTWLLSMPLMSTVEGGMPLVDAFFTATSATCVTGLMSVDTMTYFTSKGHWVLLFLIQLGGLNFIAFGSFLALASKFGVAVKQHDVIEDFVNSDNLLGSSGTLGKVVAWCLGLEALGAVALMVLWSPEIAFHGLGDRVFSSVFHSVSAFNNAGITLFTDGLAHPWVANNWLVHWVITVLVFLGALGMVALFDLFDLRKLRERMVQPWKTISFPAKIALYFSVILVVLGTVAFAALEWNGTLAGMSGFGKFTTAVFQSVTRTSGFNTVDIGAVGMPMLFLLLVLMFIGASSSSTGGGIKTSTLAIVLADVWRTVRGGDHVQIFKRTISTVLRSRAYSVLLFFLVGNLVGVFVLTVTESHLVTSGSTAFFDLAFEHVSAMGTVGLSTGITPLLSSWGKVVLAVAMFVGRVGTLTVAFAVGGRTSHSHFKYPEGHTMVG